MSINPQIMDIGSYTSFLIWWPIIEVVEGYDDRFCEIIRRNSVRRYPDGTICLDTTKDFLDAENILRKLRESGFYIYQNTGFRSLKPFGDREYTLWTTGQYFERLGSEQGLIIAPVSATIEPGEKSIYRLNVQVKWWKRSPAENVRKRFSEALDNWADSISKQGIFGEGAAKLHAGSLSFKKSWASFFIDVSNSGQHTVNWLTLSILNCAATSTQPVSWICYGREIGDDEMAASAAKRRSMIRPMV
jgi:hypothetical protein